MPETKTSSDDKKNLDSPDALPYYILYDEDRMFLNSRFYIRPLLHLFQFDKQFRCICGKSIAADFFLFRRMSRSGDTKIVNFPVGEQCAEKLAKSCGLALPPRCPWGNAGKRQKQTNDANGWNTLNLEIYRAIQIIASCSSWLPSSTSKSAKILEYIVRNPGKQSRPFAVEVVNDLMGKVLPEYKSLTDACCQKNPDAIKKIERMSFSESVLILQKNGIRSRL